MAENAPVGTFSPPEATAEQALSPVGRMQRIMLVTDGSEYTENSVREAIDIASRCKAELFAFTVLPTPFYGSTLGEPLHDQEKRQAVERLMKVRERAEAVGLNCEILLGHGDDAWAEIIEQAEQSAMDVIVMGRRDQGDVMRSLMGSTTEKVIGRTHCDVLVVPRGAHSEGKGLIVPVDGSRYSEAAADTALKMAQRCPMPITIVSVATEEQGIAEARHLAEQIRVRMQDAPQPVELVVRVGNPDEVILTVSSDRQADMIVMGSHGRTGLDRLLLGSVSSKVIGQAVCPVWVVRL
jgi:nucleotide-binding universal stress UspA family protein